jgi:hypothetical protein
VVVTHTGYRLPYQLHCSRHALRLLLEELTTEDDDLEDDDTDDGGVEDGTDEDATLPEHTVPLMVGTSAAPPFLFSWKPKLAFAPGCRVPFQLRLLAV